MSILLYIYFSLLNLRSIIVVLAVLATIPYFIATLYVYDEGHEHKPLHKTMTKAYLFFTCFSILLSSIPDIKQMSMVFGIPAAMELSKNPDVQKIPQSVLNIINHELEEKVKKNHDSDKEDK